MQLRVASQQGGRCSSAPFMHHHPSRLDTRFHLTCPQQLHVLLDVGLRWQQQPCIHTDGIWKSGADETGNAPRLPFDVLSLILSSCQLCGTSDGREDKIKDGVQKRKKEAQRFAECINNTCSSTCAVSDNPYGCRHAHACSPVHSSRGFLSGNVENNCIIRLLNAAASEVDGFSFSFLPTPKPRSMTSDVLWTNV